MLSHTKKSLMLLRTIFLGMLAGLTLYPTNLLGADYLSTIKPILSEKCYSCHGALKQESNLRLETRELMIRGGDGGTVLDLSDPHASSLLERVTSHGSDRMPPEGEGSQLTADQISQITAWLEQGAIAPREETPVAPSEHWAFQPIKLGSNRTTTETGENIIDDLLAAKHLRRGMIPQPPASKPIQIRRIYLDLIGLPPTREQLTDPRPITEIANELLANPHYGERWARHWMDIWRYSDWYGLGEQLRNSQKHLWHWRDWIIQSLNEDKGYDRMIQEMLAGDELSPADPQIVAATGFLARNYYLFNRTTWLDNTIEHTSKAFLGLTMNCAKCHDHKYDPISHVDYYRMRAIFEPHQVRLDPIPGVTNLDEDGMPRVFDDDLDAITYLHFRGDPENPDKTRKIDPGIPAIFSDQEKKISAIDLPSTAFAPATRQHVIQDQMKRMDHEIDTAQQELNTAKENLKKQLDVKPKKTPTSQTNPPNDFFFTEDFETLNEDRWEIVGSGWEIKDGQLRQTTPTRESHFVKLKQKIPQDFEFNGYYTHEGGTTYRSVTFRFDESEDRQVNNFVYTSAHAAGPKIQVAYTRQGKSSYPAEARKSQSIQEGRRYHLRFAVRERLVNVWLDDELVVAYELPERFNGYFSLSGFDSIVSFDSITIQSLSEDIRWTKAKNSQTKKQDPEHLVKIAEAKLLAAKAEKASIEATMRADLANYQTTNINHQGTDPENNHQSKSPPTTALKDVVNEDLYALRLAAAQAQQRLNIASAKLQQLQSDKDLSQKINQETEKLNQLKELSPELIEYASFKVTRKALESPADKETSYPAVYARQSTGRRKAFAEWITSRENPLTARVAVNHVWMRHFGEPLVDTVFDFGLRAKKPIHQDILDALAAEFIASDWSLKHLHRIIVTSQAYLRSTTGKNADQQTVTQDPENRFLWKMQAKRMESQLLRDCLLALSSQLDLTIGGPSLDHNHQPPRRGLYLRHSPDSKEAFLETFDNANALACYRRSESIVPQQALALVNSQLSLSAAKELNRSLHTKGQYKNDTEFIQTLFQFVLAREADDQEITVCLDFLSQLNGTQKNPTSNPKSKTAMDRKKAREHLVHSILNHHEFITIR